jgi:hypothetical protein
MRRPRIPLWQLIIGVPVLGFILAIALWIFQAMRAFERY